MTCPRGGAPSCTCRWGRPRSEGAPDPDRRLSEIAHHLALAAPLGDVQRTIEYLERAGDRAATMLAYEEAARHYGRGLQLLGTDSEGADRRRCDLLLRLGDAQWRAGDVAAARSSFEDATAVARRLGEGELLARAALGYVTALGGFLLYARFEVGATGAGLLTEALAALPDDDTPLRDHLLSRLALELYSANEPIERRAKVSDEAIEVARRIDDPKALVTAFHARHWTLTVPELVLERLEHTEEMLAAAEQIADREMEFLAHNARFHCFLELGDGPALDREIEAMAVVADLIRQPFYLWHTLCLRVVRAILDARHADAEAQAATALELGRLRQSEYPTYVYHYAQLFAIRWAEEGLGEFWFGLDHTASCIRGYHGGATRSPPLSSETGRPLGQRSSATRTRTSPMFRETGYGSCTCARLPRVRRSNRRRTRGRLLYELLRPHGDRNAISYTLQPFGPVALRLGMLAALLDRPQINRHFAAALARCELLGAPAIRARTLIEHARALANRGEPPTKAARSRCWRRRRSWPTSWLIRTRRPDRHRVGADVRRQCVPARR